MQKYNNQRVSPCIFEQKTISEQNDLILAHCALALKLLKNISLKEIQMLNVEYIIEQFCLKGVISSVMNKTMIFFGS